MKILLAMIITGLAIATPARSLTIQEAVETALQHNPQIARAEALEKAAEARTGIAKAPFWPSAGVDYRYWKADRDPNFASGNLSSTSAYARLNLFNGGSDWFRLDAAESKQASAQWQHKSAIADVVLEVRQAYIEALRTEQNLASERKSLELLERQHRNAELRLEQGLIARNDLLRIAVEMATAQQKVVLAEGNLTISRNNLARTLGHNIDKGEPLEPVSYSNLALDSAQAMTQEMLAARSELKYLHSQLRAQTASRKAVYGDFMPDIDLSYSYDQFGNNSYPDSDDTDYDRDSTTMLQASWTLFSGFDTRYEIAARKQEILALKEEIRATENLLQVQLSTAIEGHRTAETNLETARKSLELAKENYRVNESRYNAQVAATVDLLDAQEFLTRARNEEIKAQYDLYNAEAVIDRVLERNNP